MSLSVKTLPHHGLPPKSYGSPRETGPPSAHGRPTKAIKVLLFAPYAQAHVGISLHHSALPPPYAQAHTVSAQTHTTPLLQRFTNSLRYYTLQQLPANRRRLTYGYGSWNTMDHGYGDGHPSTIFSAPL